MIRGRMAVARSCEGARLAPRASTGRASTTSCRARGTRRRSSCSTGSRSTGGCGPARSTRWPAAPPGPRLRRARLRSVCGARRSLLALRRCRRPLRAPRLEASRRGGSLDRRASHAGGYCAIRRPDLGLGLRQRVHLGARGDRVPRRSSGQVPCDQGGGAQRGNRCRKAHLVTVGLDRPGDGRPERVGRDGRDGGGLLRMALPERRSARAGLAPPAADRLADLAIPVLVVTGARDLPYNEEVASTLAAKVQGPAGSPRRDSHGEHGGALTWSPARLPRLRAAWADESTRCHGRLHLSHCRAESCMAGVPRDGTIGSPPSHVGVLEMTK